MRTNIRGWKVRQAAARLRQQNMAERMRLNAIRRAHYEKMERGEVIEEAVDQEPEKAPEAKPEVTPEADKEAAPEANQGQTQETNPETSGQGVENAPKPEDMKNAELRAALEAKGFEVPKTTARTRLIELYKEHVEKK